MEGATGKNGSVTEEKIAEWSADPEWSGQNTAIRHHLTMGIDVDHYGDKNGADQLALLESKYGILPGTPSTTARGADSPSRQYVFALREPVVMYGKPPIEGLKPEQIHIEVIQAHHRYSVVWPSVNPDADNAPYIWYDAEGQPMELPPHIDDLEYLPEAWLEYLTADERDYEHTAQQWDGDIPETASATEERKLRAIVARLQGLPEVWAPGAGWHEIVFRSACWLARIAQSNAYALTADQALQLLLDYTPTYGSAWPVDRIIEQWESALTTTKGQFEAPPEPERPPLLPWHGFPTDRTFPTVNGELFTSLWMSLPANESRAGLWGRRHTLFVALLQGGFTDQEAATIVWHSQSAAHPGYLFCGVLYHDTDSRIITESELWRELEQAREEIAKNSGATVDAAPADERPSLERVKRISYLTPREEEILAGPAGVWWGSRFLEWAEATFSHVNQPYYRMNRWTVLSVIFAPKAVLPRPGGNDRPLNLYQAIVGTTTSGKTEALRVCKHTFKAYFLLADSPDIGGNHTPESLAETLVAKDGQATWFHVDEAHTKIAVWKKPVGPYSEMPGVITDVYDGDVGAIYRATKKETSGKGAQAFMTAHFMGTPQGMADIMGPDDWESGFLNRFVWAIGDLPVDSMESVAGDWINAADLEADENADAFAGLKIYQQWAAEFSGAVSKVSRQDGKQSRMRLSHDVIARHREFAWELSKLATSRTQYTERLRPTFRRLGETVLRCAALVALSRGRLEVTIPDLLIAIQQAEEWTANILIMVEATDESLRTREVNAIEQAVLRQGGAMPLAAVHRLPRFRNRRREVEDLIAELVAQGRADRDKTTGVEYVRTKGITNEGIAA